MSKEFFYLITKPTTVLLSRANWDHSCILIFLYCTFALFLAIDGLNSDTVKHKLKSNKYFKMNISTFSEVLFNKNSALGILKMFNVKWWNVHSQIVKIYAITKFMDSQPKNHCEAREVKHSNMRHFHAVFDIHYSSMCKNVNQKRFLHPYLVVARIWSNHIFVKKRLLFPSNNMIGVVLQMYVNL